MTVQDQGLIALSQISRHQMKRPALPKAEFLLQRFFQNITLREYTRSFSSTELKEISSLVDVIQHTSFEPFVKNRIPGLSAHPNFWMSDDFNDPLPDEFWFGDGSDPLNEK